MSTAVPPDHLALQSLYYWETANPQRIALTQPLGNGQVKTYTWGQVADETRRMAAYLKAQGWPEGSKVAILSKNCAWWLMSDLAIWMAGYVSVPLYPTLAAGTITQILEHSESKMCFVGKLDGWENMKPGVPADMPCISYQLSPDDVRARYQSWDEVVVDTQPLRGQPVRGADELATLIYTSGTTGAPKGVMHTFGNFAWALMTGLGRVPMNQNDRMLSYLPLAHVVERVLVEHGWLRTGMHIYFADSLETFTADLNRAKPTIFFSVPRLWVKFQQGIQAKMPQAKLDKLLRIPLLNILIRKKILTALGLDKARFCAGGAAPMPADLLKWYRRLGLPIMEGYGMTENLAVSHITLPGHDMTGTVGPAYEGVQVRIDKKTGEVQMKSGAVMKGYYKEPDLTAEAFTHDGWLRTGDKGAHDERKCLKITGRVKDLFKTSKGKYVAPAPIEDKLVMNNALEACAVVGANMGQPIGLAMLSAHGVEEASSNPDGLKADLAAHVAAINAKLDPHEQMDCLVVFKEPWTVDNGFVTPTFKVKRNRVDEVYGSQYESWAESRQKVIIV